MTLVETGPGAFALAALVGGGYAILRLMPMSAWCSGWPARFALAHLVGAATMTWLVTLGAVATDRLLIAPVYCVFGLCALASWKKAADAQKGQVEPRTNEPWRWVLVVAVLLGVASTGSGLIADRVLGIDAYSIWALKAKVFFLSGSFRPLLTDCCNKPGYPVLFPLQSWWVYRHIHMVDACWHQLMGFLFYLDTVVLTYAACRAFMRSAWAWLATAIVANNSIAVLLVTKGFADSAVGAYVLASSIFLFHYMARQEKGALAPLMLMLLGTLQTKNEGLLWATLVIAVLLVFELRQRRFRIAGLLAIQYAFGIAPWLLYKHLHTLTSGPEEPLASLHTLAQQWSWRIGFILRAHLADPSPTGFPLVLLLCAPLLLKRWRTMSKLVPGLIAAQFAAYCVIYFIVQDPVYQLNGFLPRAISQLSPALICGCLISFHEADNRPHPAATL
jgi:hypothetical protein